VIKGRIHKKNEMICVVGVALKNSKRLQEKERQRERENKSCFENTKEFYSLSVEFFFFVFLTFQVEI